MSRAVRIRQHLYDEIERLAKSERRSLISQLEVLLEQALELPEQSGSPKEERVEIEQPAEVVEDAAPRRKRARPCQHYKGTDSFCPICDV